MNYTVIVEDGSEYGPYSVGDLSGLASEGRLQPGSRLRRDDGYLTTAGAVLSYWSRPASQQQTYRPPAPTNQPIAQSYRPTVQPYRPSVQPIVVEPEELRYASIGLRIGAFLIDGIFYSTVAWGLLALSAMALLAGNYSLYKFLTAISYIFSYLGIMFLFYVFFAATPGKLLLGLRVVSLDGSPPSVGQVLKRMSGYLLCLGIPLAFWGMFSGPEYRSLIEKFAGTATVRIN